MRIATNKISSIIKFFHEELKSSFNKEEIENFIFYSLNEYLGFSRSDVILKNDTRVSESELLKFNKVVKQLKVHKPIQYILGSAHFLDLNLYVNENVLIPRPETEELVDLIIKENRDKRNMSILDIGTGSGCIAIALAKKVPFATVTAIDISDEALDIAKQNAEKNQASVNFIQADIFNETDLNKLASFDIIVSNPPYVLLSEKDKMEKNVLEYEPHLALFVNDNDPLIYYKRISELALKKLNSSGRLYFEINEKMGEESKNLLESIGFENVILKQDINRKNRILYGSK